MDVNLFNSWIMDYEIHQDCYINNFINNIICWHCFPSWSRTGTPGPWPPTAWVWPRTSASSPRSVQQSPCQSHPPPRRSEAVRHVLVWLQAGGHGLGHLGPGRSVELGLARILGAGGGPEQGGQRSHRPPRHLGSAVGGQLRLLVDAGHAGDW